MKKFKKVLAMVLALSMLIQPISVSAAIEMGTKPENGTIVSTDGNVVEPFQKGVAGSNSFRIPALVTLSDGTLVAAADARWNTTYDGGGLDTIVARSTDADHKGTSWEYTFANYLGDNGNVYSGSGSTAFIDPALAVTDDDTIYMLVDLYPYGVALNGVVGDDKNTWPVTDEGFDEKGRLLLSNDDHVTYGYYLEGGKIYSSDGTLDTNYEVDEYFNITGTDGTKSNLFFSDSPYKVKRTGFLYLTTSTDKGVTWREPKLLNLKTSQEMVCLVAPGRGLVTSTGMIVFPVYSYHGDNDPTGNTQRMSFIYSTDGTNWDRTSELNYNWASESAVVELKDGTLRFFFRNGTTNLCYVDYKNDAWGTPVNTGLDTNSNCQISAITYSKTVDGKQVILVSCPTGPNEAGSNDSRATYRLNGKIFVGLVESNNAITWQDSSKIDVTSNDNHFMYSCLTELQNGDIGILYEDAEYNWGTGDNSYYTMDYQTYTLENLTFDGTTDEDTDNENVSATVDVVLKVGESKSYTDNTGNYEGADTNEEPDGQYASMTVTGTSVSAKGTLLIDNSPVDLKDCLYNFTLNDKGYYEIESASTSGVYLNHFSTTQATCPNCTTKGQIQVVASTEYENMFKLIAQKSEGSSESARSLHFHMELATPYWNRCGSDASQKCHEYLYRPVKSGETSSTELPGYIQITSSGEIKSGEQYLIVAKNEAGNYYVLHPSTSSTDALEHIAQVTASAETVNTEITFTGVKVGTTTAVVGNTTYNITVERNSDSATISMESEIIFRNAGTVIESNTNPKVATGTLSNGVLTVTTVSEGTTTITTDYGIYNIIVVEGYAITVPLGSELTVSPKNPYGDGSVPGVALISGQYIKWTSENNAYVGVAGVYNLTSNVYTDEADIFGQQITKEPIMVTGTVYNADGSVSQIYKWAVTVTEAASTTTPVVRYFNVDQVLHCTLYYSVNGGDLIQINGTGVSIVPDTPHTLIDGLWYGNLSLMFFAAPDEGYTLTDLFVEESKNQYYVLSDGGNDVTASSAWPLAEGADVDAIGEVGGVTYSLDKVASRYLLNGENDTVYYTIKNSSSWKTIDGDKHGFRWALLEGYVTIERLQELYEDAYDLGCTGATTVTKAKTNASGTGTEADPISICAVAQKLPTIEKKIVSLKRDGVTYTGSNMNLSNIQIGDELGYKIIVTVYATDEYVQYWDGTEIKTFEDTHKPSVISYTEMDVEDTLYPELEWTRTEIESSETADDDKELTVNYSIVLAASNFLKYVKDGKISNKATLSYKYSSTYGKGTYGGQSEVMVEAYVAVPEYVIDFGLPVEIDLKSDPLVEGYDYIVEAKAEYGEVEILSEKVEKDGEEKEVKLKIVYKPTKVLKGADFISLKISDVDGNSDNAIGYGVRIYPATTVYYEEWFAENGTGDWASISNTTTLQQTAEEVGEKSNVYGYDDAYNAVEASNGSKALSDEKSIAFFEFRGTGVDIYTNNDTNSGILMAWIKNAAGKTVKLIQVDTHMQDGDNSYFTSGQDGKAYNVPVISLTGLELGDYSVELRHVNKRINGVATYLPLELDGFRVHGTLDLATDAYKRDNEAGPVFFELRNGVLAGLNIDTDTSEYAEQIAADTLAQVYASAEGTAGAIVLTGNGYTGATSTAGEADVQDLLDNGPKNELYLRAGDAVVFKVPVGFEVQVGMKALNAELSYSLNGSTESVSLGTSTDMFYVISGIENTDGTQTITIKNEAGGILSLTEVKLVAPAGEITAEPMLLSLEEEDLNPVMKSFGIRTTPVYKDAVLNIAVNDVDGKELATTSLTANGIVGESSTFTAAQIQAAVEELDLPDGYELKDAEYKDVEVSYGEEGNTAFTAEKKQEQKPTEEPKQEVTAFTIILKVFKSIFNILSKWLS